MTREHKLPKLPKPRVEYHILEGDGVPYTPERALSLKGAHVSLHRLREQHVIVEPARIVIATTTYSELEPG